MTKFQWATSFLLCAVVAVMVFTQGCIATGVAYKMHVNSERQEAMMTATVPLDGWKPSVTFTDFAAMNPGLVAIDALLLGGVAYWATDGFDFATGGSDDGMGANVTASDNSVVTISQGNAESRSKSTSEASRSISTSRVVE